MANEPLPVVAVPTTAGSGAEVSGAAMINLPALGRKMDMFGSSILPKLTIADGRLTASLPRRLTAWTGVDALSHAVEAYLCTGANPMSDAVAEGSIKLIANSLRQAVEHGDDLEARHHMLAGSGMAVMAASAAAGLGVVHSLAQTLGGFYDLPHGLTISLCFEQGMLFNAPVLPEKMDKLAQMLTNDPSTTLSADQAIHQLVQDLGITETLTSVGVKSEDVPKLAEYAMLDGCTPTNPRPLTVDEFKVLFDQLLSV